MTQQTLTLSEDEVAWLIHQSDRAHILQLRFGVSPALLVTRETRWALQAVAKRRGIRLKELVG